MLDEVRALLDAGYGRELRPLRAIGYRQAVAVVRGELDLEAARRDIVTETMRYAKRQMTWFRHQADVHVVRGRREACAAAATALARRALELTGPFRRAIVVVCDGLGVGEAPDAAAFGDQGSDTLGHVLASREVRIPNLTALGLGNLTPDLRGGAQPATGRGLRQDGGAERGQGHRHRPLGDDRPRHDARPSGRLPEGFPPELIAAVRGAHRPQACSATRRPRAPRS